MRKIVEVQQEEKDHLLLLNYILDGYKETIKTQAKRKPDAPMSLKQVRTVNAIFRELQSLFTGCETQDYLQLAEEPDPDHDIPGITNGEMLLLLSAYRCTLNAALYGHLRIKEQKG